MTSKTPGQLAYEADVAARPCYEDGAPRAAWDRLGTAERDTWERNPTPRWTRESFIAFTNRRAKLGEDLARLVETHGLYDVLDVLAGNCQRQEHEYVRSARNPYAPAAWRRIADAIAIVARTAAH